jgi:hypothetical protein
MTFEDATAFKIKNAGLAGEYSPFLRHPVACLLIAPFDISGNELAVVYKRTKENTGNETALQDLGFNNGDMDVYVVWEPVEGVVENMRLAAYLAAAGVPSK